MVYLYHKALGKKLGDLNFNLATKQRQLPVVLSPSEVIDILSQLNGRNRLVIELLYGSGLRMSEALKIQADDNKKGVGSSLPSAIDNLPFSSLPFPSEP
ncbi:hypothetical protein [Idiomarina aminovorans]|uniref:hypothetical protein n=1 Tax=Idiomarina aminovorans TaxID=2914829 RepID=UPI002005D859|nr:hypothetical protein [Idiomarina sp. ATCH4]MCK7458885.1 hypothetical protein [Idiomarina sp. ATCH4]